MSDPTQVSVVSMETIERIVTKMSMPVVDERLNDIFTASLVMALITQKEDITPKQLFDGVKGMSEWLVLFLDSIESPPPTKEQLN